LCSVPVVRWIGWRRRVMLPVGCAARLTNPRFGLWLCRRLTSPKNEGAPDLRFRRSGAVGRVGLEPTTDGL
jgi:hypothetical protein